MPLCKCNLYKMAGKVLGKSWHTFAQQFRYERQSNTWQSAANRQWEPPVNPQAESTWNTKMAAISAPTQALLQWPVKP